MAADAAGAAKDSGSVADAAEEAKDRTTMRTRVVNIRKMTRVAYTAWRNWRCFDGVCGGFSSRFVAAVSTAESVRRSGSAADSPEAAKDRTTT